MSWFKQYSKRVCAFLLPVMLVACGFALRGAYELPPGMSKTYIQTQKAGSEMLRNLQRYLRDASIVVLQQPDADSAILKVREATERRVLSVGTDGKALEYELRQSVTFMLDLPGSERDFPEKSISLSREYVFDRLGVLAADEQEDLLIGDMRRELARMLIEQIALYYQ